jgi:putative ABC transport system ATP-binding protein
MTDPPTPLVTTRELSYHYGSAETGRSVLRGIALDIRAGEVVLLTGPSGSGKTTLLTLIGTLRRPQEGTLQVLGIDLLAASGRQLRELRQSIRFVYQRHNLLHSLTVLQNVTACLPNAHHSDRAPGRQRAIDMLDGLGLAGTIDQKPEQLSGGQQQRVAVARALVSHPALLLADEPTASLDSEAGRQVAKAMSDVGRRLGCAVLISTHDERIFHFADRRLHIEDGVVTERPI